MAAGSWNGPVVRGGAPSTLEGGALVRPCRRHEAGGRVVVCRVENSSAAQEASAAPAVCPAGAGGVRTSAKPGFIFNEPPRPKAIGPSTNGAGRCQRHVGGPLALLRPPGYWPGREKGSRTDRGHTRRRAAPSERHLSKGSSLAVAARRAALEAADERGGSCALRVWSSEAVSSDSQDAVAGPGERRFTRPARGELRDGLSTGGPTSVQAGRACRFCCSHIRQSEDS